MSTKSQKTEDMLDQTFANFDTEVTGAETQQTQAGGKAKTNDGAKKSSNMMVFIGAGVAAVGAVTYLFVLKPMMEPAPMPHSTVQASNIKPLSAAPEKVKAPEAVAPLAQAANPTPAQEHANDPLAQAANPAPVQEHANDPLAQANQVNANPTPLAAPSANPTVQTASADPLAQANQVNANPTPVITPTVVNQPATVKTEAPVNHPQNVAAANVQSVAVVDELKSMFDKQSSEFKTVLTDIDTRVNGLQNAVNEQKNVNNSFDQRITALEGKKTVNNEVKKSSVVRSKVVHTKRKASVVKHEKNDAAVLLDKTVENKPKAEKVEKVEKSSLPSVALHSIYGGRLWIKNTDGSLSTFSAGDKLPTGEVIKSIDDEHFSVTTDKRVLKN
jgi:hypothetical protein